jgi:zinc transport system substrate-binding protein
VRTALLTVAVAAALAGCGGTTEDRDSPTIVAGFYPLAWATEQLVGPGTRVVNLTPSGAEPHDLELSPRDLETIRDADLVVYASGGFQPAVEDAVAERVGPSLDVRRADRDPHVWLDPVRFSQVVERLGRILGRPVAARRLRAALAELDTLYRESLSNCVRRTFVTTHAAFGHLAKRYGLTQLSLAGATPESEPGPREVERLISEVEETGAPVVFAEPLVSDDVAATVARGANVELSLLDPLEGLSDEQVEAGDDYASVMLDNLNALTKALECR